MQQPWLKWLFISLPFLTALLVWGIRRLIHHFRPRKRLKNQLVDWLTLPLIVSTIGLSYHEFNKAFWFLLLSVSLWGILWSATRFYYDHEIYLRKFFRSWWRFVFIMAAVWYLGFAIINLI